MNAGEPKVWKRYLNVILAENVLSALFLSTYLRNIVANSYYADFLEVIDLQKYKIIRKKGKVWNSILSSAGEPFVFVVGKN